jgi:ribose transport system permease protein
MILLNAILQKGFLTESVLLSNIATFAPLILVSIAQSVVILCGEIDLSAGAAVSLINVVMAVKLTDRPVSALIAILLALAIGLGIGAVNGLLTSYLRLPSVLVTFATAAVWFGLSLVIMPQPGGYVPAWFYETFQGSRSQFPTSMALIVTVILAWALVKARPFGRHIYAVGSGFQAAWASGVHAPRVKLQAFVLSGLFLAVAGLVLTGQVASGDASIGAPLTLSAVASVIIGGTLFRGGRGGIFGALILSILTNILYFARISSFYQDTAKGLIIIAALVVVAVAEQRRRKEYAPDGKRKPGTNISC